MKKTLAFAILALAPIAHAWGQTSTIVNCRATTSSPTYSTNTNAPCSMDTNGAIRITPGGSAPGLPAYGTPFTQTNESGTITVGGTFQTIAVANATRHSFEFHNVCVKVGNCVAATDNCYLYVAGAGTPDTSNSIVIAPGGAYLRSTGAIPNDAIQATCDGTGDHYYLTEQ